MIATFLLLGLFVDLTTATPEKPLDVFFLQLRGFIETEREEYYQLNDRLTIDLKNVTYERDYLQNKRIESQQAIQKLEIELDIVKKEKDILQNILSNVMKELNSGLLEAVKLQSTLHNIKELTESIDPYITNNNNNNNEINKINVTDIPSNSILSKISKSNLSVTHSKKTLHPLQSRTCEIITSSQETLIQALNITKYTRDFCFSLSLSPSSSYSFSSFSLSLSSYILSLDCRGFTAVAGSHPFHTSTSSYFTVTVKWLFGSELGVGVTSSLSSSSSLSLSLSSSLIPSRENEIGGAIDSSSYIFGMKNKLIIAGVEREREREK